MELSLTRPFHLSGLLYAAAAAAAAAAATADSCLLSYQPHAYSRKTAAKLELSNFTLSNQPNGSRPFPVQGRTLQSLGIK